MKGLNPQLKKIISISFFLTFVCLETTHANHYTDSEVYSATITNLSDLPNYPFTLLEKQHQEAVEGIGLVEAKLGDLVTAFYPGIPLSRMIVIKKISKDEIILC